MCSEHCTLQGVPETFCRNIDSRTSKNLFLPPPPGPLYRTTSKDETSETTVRMLYCLFPYFYDHKFSISWKEIPASQTQYPYIYLLYIIYFACLVRFFRQLKRRFNDAHNFQKCDSKQIFIFMKFWKSTKKWYILEFFLLLFDIVYTEYVHR